MADDAITVPPPGDRPAVADTSSILGSADLNPDVSPPSGVNVTPAAPAPSDVAPARAPVPRVPRQWQPRYRSGIGGIVDEMRDALVGHPTQIYEDDQGSYVGATQVSNRQKWMSIVASLAGGAGRGYAAGQGPGGQGRAFAAGLQGGMQQIAQQRQHTQEQTAEARQETLDKFNNAKQQLDLATSTLNLQRLKASTSRDEQEFYEKQVDWHKEQGDVDLGIIPDWQHPAGVLNMDPDFWKHLYQDKTISGVPVVDENGRGGIHVFLKTQNPKNIIIPAGHEIARYTPPKKPGDEGTLTYEKTAAPMTAEAFDAQNNAAVQQRHDFIKQNQQDKMAAVELDAKKQSIKTSQAQAVEAYAKANEANANARAKKIEADLAQGDILGGDVNTQAQALVDNRMAPSQLNKRAKDYDLKIRTANALSMQQKGKPYDLEEGEIGYQARKSVMEDYAHGKKRDSIGSFDMFLGHALETSQTVNNARLGKVPWLNEPINALKKNAGVSSSAEFTAFQQSLETTQREYQNFLNAGHVLDKTDKDKMDQILNDSASPAQIDEALRTYARLAGTRLRGLDFNYMSVVGSHVPNLMSPEGADAFRYFGVPPESVYTKAQPQRVLGGGGANVFPNAGPPTTPTATPAPAGGQPKIATKADLQQFATAHNMTYEQAKQQATTEGYQIKE